MCECKECNLNIDNARITQTHTHIYIYIYIIHTYVTYNVEPCRNIKKLYSVPYLQHMDKTARALNSGFPQNKTQAQQMIKAKNDPRLNHRWGFAIDLQK